jgi:hypothetical protein
MIPHCSGMSHQIHKEYQLNIHLCLRNISRNNVIPIRYTCSVYQYTEFFSHTDIPKFPIYRNFSVYRIKFTHHAYGEIINFCFTQMQSKRSRHLHPKFLRNSFEIIINGVSTFQIIQNQNFFQISTKEFSYLI